MPRGSCRRPAQRRGIEEKLGTQGGNPIGNVVRDNSVSGTERGPANRSGRQDVGYFVAVVDPQGNVISHEEFDRRLPEWLPTEADRAFVRSLMHRVVEPGKMADVVVWSADPFSVYAKALQVYNDGWLVFDRNDPAHQPRTDFELGQVPTTGEDR